MDPAQQQSQSVEPPFGPEDLSRATEVYRFGQGYVGTLWTIYSAAAFGLLAHAGSMKPGDVDVLGLSGIEALFAVFAFGNGLMVKRMLVQMEHASAVIRRRAHEVSPSLAATWQAHVASHSGGVTTFHVVLSVGIMVATWLLAWNRGGLGGAG
jgi:hypothetical protein